MMSTWAQMIDLNIQEILEQATSLEALCRRCVIALYQDLGFDCALWVEVSPTVPQTSQVYASPGFWPELALDADEDPSPVRSLSVEEVPDWITAMARSPHLQQHDNGDLLIPLVNATQSTPSKPKQAHEELELPNLTLQLRPVTSSVIHKPNELSSPLDDALETQPQSPPAHPWSSEDLKSWQFWGHYFGLSYRTLFWRQRLEQSRQRSALVGRIAHILNATLTPNEVMERIITEVGKVFDCDRCLLIDLRDETAHLLSAWETTAFPTFTLDQSQLLGDWWGDVADIFSQGGASYLEVDADMVSAMEVELSALRQWLNQIGATTMLLIPLSVQSEFFGAIALLSEKQERTYRLDELQTLRQISDQLALALTQVQHAQAPAQWQDARQETTSTLRLEGGCDELTQLLNRHAFDNALDQISTRAIWAIRPPFSLVVCDLDYFKLINDTYGHLIGDQVLQALAERLQKQLRQGTPAYRYGGEEFAIVLEETSHSSAMRVAERLRWAISSTPIKTMAGSIDVTASFGVAQKDPNSDRNAWDVLKRAELAMAEAKRDGRDRVSGHPAH